MKRGMLIHPGEISRKWIDRLADAGIEVLGIHPEGGKKACATLAALTERMKTPEYRELIDYALERGLEVEYEVHSAGYLMPKSLFEEHPEYFRMNGAGERVCDWNFCVSNPDALELFAKRAAELALSLYGSSHNFYFWMDDEKDTHCHCPKCKDLSPSDQQLIVLNTVLKEIRKHIPQAKLAYLAYYDTIPLPNSVKPEDGIFLEYAPLEKYNAKGEDAPMRIERERNMLRPLIDFFGKKDAKVLEYWYDNSLYSGWKKPPAKFLRKEEERKKDVAQYRQVGFDNIATFACFLGEDYEELHGDFDVTPFGEI